MERREAERRGLRARATPPVAGRGVTRGGFTLMELMVVLVVLGLLAGLVGPQLFGRISGAQDQTARAQIELFVMALDNYRLDNGRYPTEEQGLRALMERPATEPVPPNWRGPYLRKAIPVDPWGNPYIYRNPGEGGQGFQLLSLGQDGEPGGTGMDADISS